MQKKILLKKTREYLQSSFPENLLPTRKLTNKKKKVSFHKSRSLKIQVIKAKKQVFSQYGNSTKNVFAFKNDKIANTTVKFYNPTLALQENIKTLYPPFLFSINQIKYELLRKKTRCSDFKNKLKERKKLALLYGNLSKKFIKKILKQASKLSGKKHDNFFFLLEARLDVVIFRACFFSSIKAARQYINHNKVLVNNKLINTCSYTLKPGDIISIKPKSKIVLCRKIMHFLKKNFFKQNKNTPKIFAISPFLLQKLKSKFKSSLNTQSLVFFFKKIFLSLNFAITLFKKNKHNTKKSLSTSNYLEKTDANFSVYYKQCLSQVKQVLIFILTKYSNKNKYLHNTNLFASDLSNLEKNNLVLNLIELQSLDKINLGKLEKIRSFLVHLKLKKLFFRSEKRKKSFSILHQNVLKPLNLEISYKNLLIIYLYPPQKITFACSIDMELLSKSLI